MSNSLQLDNVLLFTKKKIGRDLQYYIRNIFIIDARRLNISMIQYLNDYKAKRLPDPVELQGEIRLSGLWGIFSDDVMAILDSKKALKTDKLKDDKVKATVTALSLIIAGLFNDYNIK